MLTLDLCCSNADAVICTNQTADKLLGLDFNGIDVLVLGDEYTANPATGFDPVADPIMVSFYISVITLKIVKK